MVDSDQTRAMQRGTAVHALLFNTRKVCGYPGATRRGKEYDKFAEAHPDSEILTMSEYDKARYMADAVLACNLAAPYLKGAVEETLLFRWMGLDCRATPDVKGVDFLTELKTAASAEPMKFTWQALRMAYHAQMRMQQIACRDKRPCFIVCVESAEPFPVTVFEVEKRTLEIGEKLLMLWAERLKNCEASDTFPPYCQSVFQLIAPEDLELEYGEAA
jgi:hypothetical protein